MAPSFTRNMDRCVSASKDLIDSVMTLIIGVEQNHYDPVVSIVVDVLYKIQSFVSQCAKKDVDIDKYDKCIEHLYPILPEVGELVAAIDRKDTQLIIEESIKIAAILTEGITVCIEIKL